MRASISSLSKTLFEFTSRGKEIQGGDTHFSWDMLESLHEKYPNTAFADDIHRETVLSLVDKVGDAFGDDTFTISYDKKGVVVRLEGAPFLVLTLLKTRTPFNLAVIEGGGDVSIPNFASYKNGMVGFSIDKKYIKEGHHESVLDFLEQL